MQVVDHCVRFMLAQLRSAVVAYGTKEHARVLDCSELAIWPLSSGAIPIAEPTGLGALPLDATPRALAARRPRAQARAAQ